MPTVQDVLDVIESFAPARWCLPDDGSGFQVGRRDAEVQTGVVSLDWSEGLADFAIESGAQLIVAHHPAIYRPIPGVTDASLAGRFIHRLIEGGIAYHAAHTNWDAAPGGISDTMASLLGLQNVMPMGFGAEVDTVKVVVFSPAEAQEAIVDAMSAAGAGVIGNYERCVFGLAGTGSFRPLEGSNPVVGRLGSVEKVEEVRIEMRAPRRLASDVVEAMRANHPYEEPAYDVVLLKPVVEMPLGRVGSMAEPCSLAEFIWVVNEAFGSAAQVWGDPDKRIETVAVAGGAADEGMWEALRYGADAFVTGEIRQHMALEGSERGLALFASGHYHTEHPGCAALCAKLRELAPAVDWRLFEPEPGRHGRPAGSEL
ncbi:MAG: Nif3-like dinuclear metal center hexameric protein [Armatimonadetes bacterium]|nr:Nif3-like dinuclear metal center hexameric protein [Armatimonadota bacterium]